MIISGRCDKLSLNRLVLRIVFRVIAIKARFLQPQKKFRNIHF